MGKRRKTTKENKKKKKRERKKSTDLFSPPRLAFILLFYVSKSTLIHSLLPPFPSRDPHLPISVLSLYTPPQKNKKNPTFPCFFSWLPLPHLPRSNLSRSLSPSAHSTPSSSVPKAAAFGRDLQPKCRILSTPPAPEPRSRAANRRWTPLRIVSALL